MKIRPILQQLPPDGLEALARQRLSQVTDIRLPQSALIDELAEALTSFAFVSNQVVLRHPPSFAIIHLLINAPDYSLPTENFFHLVQEETSRMIALASRRPIFSKPKRYDFYMKLLAAAWENEADINPSEANMLRVLREELGISLMEHFVMEHHPDLHRFWRTESAYEAERNHLRTAGILFIHEDRYVLPEEIVFLIRRAWGFELSNPQFRRLLDVLSNDDLKKILEVEGLTVSGPSMEKKSRILENYVLPRAALDALNIDSLRSAARSLDSRASGTKEEAIDNILDWLDSDEDLKALAVQKAIKEEPAEIKPEQRELTTGAIEDLLRRLTNESLYDLLSRLPGERKSGNKEQRLKRLLGSRFSERTMLLELTNETLQELCRQIGLSPYGLKEEKIARIIETYRNYSPPPLEPSQSILSTKDVIDTSGISMTSMPPPDSQLRLLLSVRSEYPYLNEAEQIVLSYLLDFKSLSDPELDKLVQRFSLPWVLPKAQMLELIDKLKTNGRNIIQIRALGDHNIYVFVS
jgi:hypothetical protein